MPKNKSRKPHSPAERSPRAEVPLPPLKQLSPPKIDSRWGAELERTITDSPNCSAGVEKPALGVPDIEERPFKPYANVSSPIEDDLYKMLSQTLSESDSRERPWCGIGLEVGLLAISPTNLTIADIREVSGVQQAVVHVPQNWREPWYVETAGGARQGLLDNPCDKAERAISSLKHSLASFLRSGEPTFRSIKYLIIFPDGYTFEGQKEFFIVEREKILTLKLKNFRDLTETILAPTQSPRMDSRKCRAWLEDSVLKKSDDSILGTWLDPAFDKVEPEPAKNDRRRLGGYLRHKKMLSENQDGASTESLLVRPPLRKFNWYPSKLIMLVVTGMIIGISGWQLYDSNKPLILGSRSNAPLSLSRPANSVNVAQVDEVAIPQNRVSSLENYKRNTAAATVRQSSKQKKPDQRNESVRKLSEQAQAFEKSELKRQKIELQIDKAIRLRAISGVTVHFVGDTAHLKGRVATESQKSAAEKAALGVSGVKDIRNSIEIDVLSSEES